MYLKSIEVQGFKSFANKIKFEFHNGITGIVGPNGSGKSNVADAVRWVFGEQSAKQLRGSSMQDVIFAGTQLRKPQGFASVSITLDNTDRALNIDYDEVTVTRKVYRSGESEYILNENQCRLKDINELFYDTGIGKEGYSIIGQGQIDKILSGRAEERRELFDEAAGIVKFKKRKAVAVKKLEAERENMVRVTDIMNELERQVGPLARQSETAKQYLKLRDEQKTYDINAFILDQESMTVQLKKLKDNLDIVEKDLAGRQSEEDALKQEYKDIDEELQELDGRLEQVRSSVNESVSDRNILEGRINVVLEQINTEKTNTEHFENRIKEIDSEIAAHDEAREQAEKDRISKSEELKKLKEALEKKQAELHEAETKIAAYRQTVEESHGQVVDILTEKGEVNAKLEHLSTLISQNQLRTEELTERLAELEKQGKALSDEIGEQEEAVHAKESEVSAKQEELRALQEELHNDELNYNSTQLKINELAQKYQIAKSRLDTLRAMAERHEGFNNAVRRVMEMQHSFRGICGTVADLFSVEERYQTLIETALGGNYQNVITETEDTAKRLVEYLKENKAGRATFLPLDSLKASGGITDEKILREEGVIGTADQLIKCEAKYEVAAKYLLERFLAVDTMEHALRVAKKYHYTLRIVTLEGEFLNVGGSLTGGSFKNNNSFLNRNAELEKLEKEANDAKNGQEELTRKLNQYKQIKDSTALEIEDIQDELQTLNVDFAELRAVLDSKRRELTALALEKKETESRILEIETEKTDAETQREAILTAIEALENANTESSDSADQTLKLIAETEEVLNALQKEAEAYNMQIAASEQADTFLEETVERLKSEAEKLKEDQLTLHENIRDAEEAIVSHKEEIKAMRDELTQSAEASKGLEETLKILTEEREALAGSQRVYFDRRDALAAQIQDLTRDQLRLVSQQEKTEEKLDSMTEYLWTEYELTPTEAVNYKDDSLNVYTQTEIRKHATELKQEIKALGNVNVNAIEQYKEVSERYEFMKGQYDDLVAAEESLANIVNDLDEGMRKQFTEKFEAISVEFDRVFKELFGGGQGTIELDPEADIIDADISIISQPPGKKLQNMMQLSGGEKALTAIALIFAIQNLKPSPFCLLDEIEAALDDSNVGRFNSYLKNLTQHTQFILITHRRGTMVAADRLYGITMQEKGVSTLVSVNLVEEALDA